MKRIQILLAIVLLVLLVVSPVIAADTAVAIKAGTTTKDATSIVMDKGCVTFTSTDTKLSATTTTLIDGKLFVPETTTEKSTSLAWETPDAKMEYSYTGKTLKETITLKEDKKLSFPITLAKDSKLIPWDNGQWKIVSSVTKETMVGVVLEKPYGIDNKNNRIEMEYTYRDGILNLEYNRTITKYTITNGTLQNGTPYSIFTPVYSEITYPLVIDPTWVVVGDRVECSDCVSGYVIVKWTTSGSTTWTVPAGVTQVDYLLVAGGGGGGSGRGAGGGAGGYLTNTGLAVSGIETIVVGAGGNGGVGQRGTIGVNSSLTNDGVTKVADGGGGGASTDAGQFSGSSGGSGGGSVNPPDGGLPGTGTVGQGNNGGAGVKTAPNYGAGGGGGGTAVGVAGTATTGGNGGAGYSSSITGIAVDYAGGGGGGTYLATGTPGSGGAGGGGAGGENDDVGTDGTDGLGGGGGGGGYGSASRNGGNGGDGVVIVKYLAPVSLSIAVTPYQSSIYATKVNFILSPPNASPQNWSFGDTYTSTRNSNVTHFYSVAGNYTVNHSVTIGAALSTTTVLFNLTSDVDTNVKSWLHMNGANGGTLFPGEVGSAWVPNSVTTDTGTKKFGTASALFNANGDRLSTPSSAVFNFGTGNFTIEQWVYPTSSASNDFIISRTTSGATKADGWGLYHSTASATSDGWVFWAGTAAAGSTGTFSIPLNTWNHVVVQRIDGTVNVSVNGIQVAQKTGVNGNYDTANDIAYGDPIAGAGTNSAKMYLDETRMSTEKRWDSGGTDFSSPYAEYRGNLLSLYTDLNPNSTLRFKTDAPNPAVISNITARNRTVQIQYFQNATNISTTVVYNPNHVFASYVYANTTMFSGVNITHVSYDTALGQVKVNATRPSGFYTGSFTDSRAAIFDIRMVYWNYTPSSEQIPGSEDDIANYQYFANGYQRNGTTGYEFPIHNFITTNVTFTDWVTFSNFTTSDRVVGNQTIFTPSENNFTANRWSWDFGDGTPTIIGNASYPEPHVYATPGTYNVSCNAYLWQNISVSNMTYLPTTITYSLTYVNANLIGVPTLGNVGTLVQFTDLTVWGNSTASGRLYNWSFGDGEYSNLQSPSHVYSYFALFTVTLQVNNTQDVTLGSDIETRPNYITITSSATESKLNVLYPHEVQFALVDGNGQSLPNVEVAAVMTNSTIQNTNWLFTLFGISGQATPLTNGTVLYGTSDSGGQFTLPLISSGRYTFTFNSTTYGISESRIVYPQQSNYIFVLRTNALPILNMNSYINATLYQTVPNTSYVFLNFSYSDLSLSTTSVSFYVDAANRTRIYSDNIVGTSLLVNSSHMVANIASTAYVWGYYADTTKFGNVSASQGIIMKGATNRLVDIDPCGGYVRGWGNAC